MPTHAENRVISYTPAQMYDLVADIERYPEFLPWCVDVRKVSEKNNVVEAQVAVGFKALRERFTSRNTLTPKSRIEVE